MTRYARHQHHKKRRTLIVAHKAQPRLVDRLTYFAAILEPLFTIPQVYAIYHQRTAAGVSLSAWIGYDLLSLVWLWYAVVHKERVILIYQGLFFILQTAVIIGGIMYHAAL